MVTPLKKLLDQIVTKYTQESWQTMVMQQWPTIVGKLADRMYLEKIQGTTLVIGVYDAHWMQELFMLSPTIIALINRALPSPQVQQLRFVLARRTKGTQNPGRARRAGTGRISTVDRLSAQDEQLLAQQVGDEALRAELRRMGLYRKS